MAKKKRMTLTEKTAEQKELLRRRLMDIAHGAGGGADIETDHEDKRNVYMSFGAEGYTRWLMAVKRVFPAEEQRPGVYALYSVDEFATIEGTVEWLWINNIRPTWSH